eukprot:COSAG01_NODE_2136_length_8334_cov_319.754706_9_plen_99_part_00
MTLLLPLACVAIATLAVAASRSADDLINSRQLHVQHYAVIIRAVVKDDVLLIASRPESSGAACDTFVVTSRAAELRTGWLTRFVTPELQTGAKGQCDC